MQTTDNAKLNLYELTDPANLADGYNGSMQKIDKWIGETDDKFPITAENIANHAIETSKIQNGAVTNDKLASASVTSDKIAQEAVETNDIKNKSVTAAKLADNAAKENIGVKGVTSDMIAEGAALSNIADNSIDEVKLKFVSENKLADNAALNNISNKSITNDKLAEGVAAENIGAKGVTSDMLADNAALNNISNKSITNDKLADGEISKNKLDGFLQSVIANGISTTDVTNAAPLFRFRSDTAKQYTQSLCAITGKGSNKFIIGLYDGEIGATTFKYVEENGYIVTSITSSNIQHGNSLAFDGNSTAYTCDGTSTIFKINVTANSISFGETIDLTNFYNSGIWEIGTDDVYLYVLYNGKIYAHYLNNIMSRELICELQPFSSAHVGQGFHYNTTRKTFLVPMSPMNDIYEYNRQGLIINVYQIHNAYNYCVLDELEDITYINDSLYFAGNAFLPSQSFYKDANNRPPITIFKYDNTTTGFCNISITGHIPVKLSTSYNDIPTKSGSYMLFNNSVDLRSISIMSGCNASISIEQDVDYNEVILISFLNGNINLNNKKCQGIYIDNSTLMNIVNANTLFTNSDIWKINVNLGGLNNLAITTNRANISFLDNINASPVIGRLYHTNAIIKSSNAKTAFSVGNTNFLIAG